ncbi:Type II secretory pathway, component PulL [Salinisphaera sp. T31B1]
MHWDGEQAAWLDGDGTLVRATLAESADAAGEREAMVVIPGEQLLLTQVHLPPIRQARRRLQAAGFALEDQLAARVDSLHFALAARPEANGDTAAVVIDRLRLAELLADCRDAGLDVVQLIPDILALPVPAADAWQVLLESGRVITRTGARAGFAAERDLWPVMAGAAEPPARIVVQTGAEPARVEQLIDDAGFDPRPAIERIERSDDDALLTALLANIDTGQAINLRQGEFARASGMQTWWHPFKLTAGLAAAWLVLAIGARAVESWQLHQRIDALEAQSVAAFRDAFPNVQTINDLRVQAEQNIRSLRGTSGAGGGLFSLLQATAEVTGQAGDVSVQSMQYRDGALYLSLRGDNVQSLEALRAGFARQPGAALTVESADAAADGVQIRASVTHGAGA